MGDRQMGLVMGSCRECNEKFKILKDERRDESRE